MQMIFIYPAIAALVAALLALFIYHAAVVRPALERIERLVATHDELIGGGAGAAGRLGTIEERLTALQASVERVAGRASELEALARTDISRVGFVRYDAFDNSGAELSYALALLNREGDGIVLSSIYSRADSRTFGKAVRGFKPVVNASDEELRAIENARSSQA
jgi:hypothetical protein